MLKTKKKFLLFGLGVAIVAVGAFLWYANVDVTTTPGQISLSATSNDWVETDDADFDLGEETDGFYISGGNLSVKKPIGAPCSSSLECDNSWCISSVCAYSVTIGSQIWMAGNLNVGTMIGGTSIPSNNGVVEKYCYGSIEDNCETDGGLYNWNEAMGYLTTAGTQGICPAGWHIPTNDEWHTLENFLKDVGQTCIADRINAWDCNAAGAKLKANITGYNGNNSSNFTALLAGGREAGGSFGGRSSVACFWSSSESGSGAWYRNLRSSEAGVGRGADAKASGFSIRCLKD